MEERHYPFVSNIGTEELEQLMDRYGEDVWQYAFFLTKNPDWADDIAQDVFIKAYKSIHAFRGDSTIKTWLLKITRNTSYSYRKKAYFKFHVFGRSAEPAGQHPSAESVAVAREYSHRIWAHVMQLSDKYREAIVLSAHYQYSTEEIADLLQIPANTVKSRLRRARRELHNRMKGDLQHDD